MSSRRLPKVRVWDLPTRLFHWTLVLLMLLLFVSAYAGQLSAHAGLMVVVLLAALLSQAVLGLCSSDGLTFDGPLAHRIGPVAADTATRAHVTVAYVIGGLVAMHVVAVLWHWWWRNENLVVPMLTGRKHVPPGTAPPRFVSTFVALGMAASMAVLVALAIRAA